MPKILKQQFRASNCPNNNSADNCCALRSVRHRPGSRVLDARQPWTLNLVIRPAWGLPRLISQSVQKAAIVHRACVWTIACASSKSSSNSSSNFSSNFSSDSSSNFSSNFNYSYLTLPSLCAESGYCPQSLCLDNCMLQL